MSLFCDSTTITVQAGKGGDGAIAFRREEFVDKGGPEGGDGGKGGSVIFKVNPHLNTLTHLDAYKIFRAEEGEPGGKDNCHGANAEDLTLEVPPGTLVYQVHEEKESANSKNHAAPLLADLSSQDVIFVAAQGGRGGFGNAHFISSVRQAPKFAELGEAGEERHLRLELKLMADVAIIGIPSAGKSSLIAAISNARPKIANYPFTTLIPNLGVVTPFPNERTKTMVVADIPGLIEGAHEGRGLGIEFLKHVERSRLLVHLVDPTQGDPAENFEIINKELKAFNPELAKRKQIVVINKADVMEEDLCQMVLKDLQKKQGRKKNLTFFPKPISAAAHKNTPDLIKVLYRALQTVPPVKFVQPENEETEYKIFRPHLDDPEAYTVEKLSKAQAHALREENHVAAEPLYSGRTLPRRNRAERDELKKQQEALSPGKQSIFRITGKRIAQIAHQTDLSNREARMRLEDVLRKMGIEKEVKRLGGKLGDLLFIGGKLFTFRPRE